MSSPIASGFLGVSMEYSTVEAYEGGAIGGPNPVLATLIRALAPGQTPVLRIGGDSTDWAWWPAPDIERPAGIRTALGPAWLTSANQLVSTTGAHVILGVNLEANAPALAAVEANALLTGIGAPNIAAFEIGNEPQLYPTRPWYFTADGRPQYGRPPNYSIDDYISEFRRFAAELPHVPLAGPSSGRSWLAELGSFINAHTGTRMVTYHAYAVNSTIGAFRGHDCLAPSGDPTYPTVRGLLAPVASLGIDDGLLRYVVMAHRHGLSFRVDETTAITCAGLNGVSNTFASALWALNMLFGMAQLGVDGVNVHTWRGSAGKLFTFNDTPAGWTGSVRPEYYGLLMFADAAPPGSRLLRIHTTAGSSLDVWALRAPDRSIRVVLINDTMSHTQHVTVDIGTSHADATLQLLAAHSATSTSGVTLDCQSFGTDTTTGVIAGTPCPTTLRNSRGRYSVTLPAATAAMVTVPPPGPVPTPAPTSPGRVADLVHGRAAAK